MDIYFNIQLSYKHIQKIECNLSAALDKGTMRGKANAIERIKCL